MTNMNKWDFLKQNYIDKKIKIIPIQPNKKIPMIPKWNEDCSCDFMQILYWYESNHNMNFAIPCFENNLFVIDLDRHDSEKDGVINFNKLLNDLGIDKIETLTQTTPSKGQHLIFQSDDELSNVNGLVNAFPDYPGIDLRNRNYILAEPSIINNKTYCFTNNIEPQKMPEKLKQYILDNVESKNDSKKEPYKKPTLVECGDRDNQLFSYINNIYFKTPLDFDEVLVLANHFNENVLEKPFSSKTVKYKVEKVFEKDRSSYIYIKLSEE